MDTTSIIVGASGWLFTALWGLWLWHHKQRISRVPEKNRAELGLMHAEAEKLRSEKEHLDAMLEALQDKQRESREKAVSNELLRQERDAAITALEEYSTLNKEIMGLSGIVQAYYSGRYAWAVHGMPPAMLETAPQDEVLSSARSTFENAFRLATKYKPDSERIDDLKILAKRLKWDV